MPQNAYTIQIASIVAAGLHNQALTLGPWAGFNNRFNTHFRQVAGRLPALLSEITALPTPENRAFSLRLVFGDGHPRNTDRIETAATEALRDMGIRHACPILRVEQVR